MSFSNRAINMLMVGTDTLQVLSCTESKYLMFGKCSFSSRTIHRSQKDIVLPLSESITGIDGTLIKEIPVPAGTTFVAGIQAINCSKEIWGEDALEFKPERWLSPLPSSVNDAHIPGVYSNL